MILLSCLCLFISLLMRNTNDKFTIWKEILFSKSNHKIPQLQMNFFTNYLNLCSFTTSLPMLTYNLVPFPQKNKTKPYVADWSSWACFRHQKWWNECQVSVLAQVHRTESNGFKKLEKMRTLTPFSS